MNRFQKVVGKALGIMPKSEGNRKNPGQSNTLAKSLIDAIVNKHKDYARKSIDKWRVAIKMAQHPENPRRDLLYSIIEDLRTDGHLQAVIMIRKTATLNTDFKIKSRKTGEADEDKTKFMQHKWFYDMMSDLLDTPLLSHTLLQLLAFVDEKVVYTLVPRAHVVPNFKRFIPDLSAVEKFLDYTEGFDNVLIEMGDDLDLGALNDLVPDLIWKRNVMQAWAEFTDKYGNPFITANTHNTDDEHMDGIVDKLLELGESAVGVFPTGTDVAINEADRTDAYMTFDKKIERHDKQISKRLIGGTMITDDGSSKSQSQVHASNLDDKIAKAERRSISFVVNDQLLPNLIALGWGGFTDDDEFVFDTSESLGLKEHWKIVKEMMDKYEVEEAWLSKTFNVPITGKKSLALPTGDGGAKANLSTLSPMAVLGSTLTSKGFQMPNYDACCSEAMLPVAGFDDSMSVLHETLFEELFANKSTLSTAAKITATEAIKLVGGLHKGWAGRTDIAYNEPDHLALSLMEYNLFEFATTKTEARLAACSELLIDKKTFQIKSLGDFKREAYKVVDKFNGAYLSAEYNLSIAVGASGANWQRMLSEQNVIPYWEYQTVGDSNVRPEHAALDGMIFRIDDVSARSLIAPNGYGCRCENVQHPYEVNPKRITKGTDAIGLMPEGFGKSQFNINRGDTKQVFTKKQFYSDIKGLPEKLDQMTYDKFGLPAIKDMTELKKLGLDDTITKDNAQELFRIDGKQGDQTFQGFEDYLKRKVIIKKGVFAKHTKGKYVTDEERRHQLYPHINQLLKSPDEVWLHEYKPKKFSSRYIKHFEGKSVVVDVELGANNLEIKTWYELKTKEKEKRNGLLIKNRPFIK